MILGIDASNIKAGGGLVHLKNLIRFGDPEKYGISKVVMWGGNQLDDIADKDWLDKIKPKHLVLGGIWNETYWKLTLFEKEALSKCDIIFSPGGTFYSKKIPYVSMSQNMLVFDKNERNRFFFSFDWVRLNLLNYLQTRSIKNATANIFISNFAKNTISNLLQINKKEATVIYHGIDDIFKSKPKKCKRISEYNATNRFKILYVSIIENYKHQWVLIEAISKLINKDKLPIELNLIGGYGQSAKKKFQNAISKFDPQNEYVRYYGKIPHHELSDRYKASDLFAFSSSCENMPNILIEAICSGLPVVSSDYGPMVEILGNKGIYYKASSVEDTYQALKKTIINPEIRKDLCKLSTELSDSFSWQKCADETFKYLANFAIKK